MASDDRFSPGSDAIAERKHRLQLEVARVAAVGTALLLVTILVVSVSRAAFTATTGNSSNSVSSGSISLTDDDSGSAMFNSITGLVPSTTVSRCIHVSYGGTVDPTAVRLYAAGVPTGTLAGYLNLTVEVGPANSDPFTDCSSFSAASTPYSGTLSGFASTYPDYANGLSTWDPAAGSSGRTFRFSVAVQDDPAAAGLTTSFGVTWETRSS